jgi:hypothetical protein
MLRKEKKSLRDAYYTDETVAKNLIKLLNDKIDIKQFKLIVEPSAGNGSFLNSLPTNIAIIGIDTNPKNNKIIKQNFLTWKPPRGDYDPKYVLCIGNPPFGRQSALVKRFVEKCSTFSDHIAFIVPTPFRAIPKEYKEMFSVALPDNIFVDSKGNAFKQSIKTKFVYYTRRDNSNNDNSNDNSNPKPITNNGLWEIRPKSTPKDRNSADFRIVRVSGTPGRAISRNSEHYQTRGDTYNDYYIRISYPIRRYVNSIIDDINEYERKKKWIFNNTTTFKSIDRNQLTAVLNKITSRYVNANKT